MLRGQPLKGRNSFRKVLTKKSPLGMFILPSFQGFGSLKTLLGFSFLIWFSWCPDRKEDHRPFGFDRLLIF
jgi:hypothetical protein